MALLLWTPPSTAPSSMTLCDCDLSCLLIHLGGFSFSPTPLLRQLDTNKPVPSPSQGLSCTNRVTAFLLQAILIVYVIGKGDIFFPTYYISKRFLLNNSFPMRKGVVTRNNCTLCLEWLVSWRQRLSLMNQRLPSNGACFTEKNVWLTSCLWHCWAGLLSLLCSSFDQ